VNGNRNGRRGPAEAAEVLQTLGHERSLLQQKIDELRTFERDYRAA